MALTLTGLASDRGIQLSREVMISNLATWEIEVDRETDELRILDLSRGEIQFHTLCGLSGCTEKLTTKRK